MDSFGWANAWRSLCWARLKDAEKAYQLIVNNLRPSIDGSNGTALNLFDIYEVQKRPRHLPDRRQLRHARGDDRDAAVLPARATSNCSRRCPTPGRRPATSRASACAAASRSTCAGATGKPTEARIHSVGGRTTTVAYGNTSRDGRR